MTCLEAVDDRTGPNNLTRRDFTCRDGHWYRIRLRVTATAIEGWVDGEKVVDLNPAGHTFSLHPNQFPLRPFGLRTWKSHSALRNLRLRRLKTSKADASPRGARQVYTDWQLDSAEAKRRQEETAKALNLPVEKVITDQKLVFRAPARTERCAGQGELVFGLTEHGGSVQWGGWDVSRHILPGSCGAWTSGSGVGPQWPDSLVSRASFRWLQGASAKAWARSFSMACWSFR
jgi:hypothetical protein